LNKYYSQHGEDALLDLIFKDQERGFFIEVGCIDGRRFSNTLTFEERGWKGICVEAHAGYIESLKTNRPNSIICQCAAGEADEDAIFYANARGSLSTLDKSKEAQFQHNYGAYFSGFEEQHVKKVRLSTLLDAYQVGEIDILSLDIEGYEVEALKGLDLSRHRPKVLVIESDNSQHEVQLDALILPHGYTKSVKLNVNQYYVRDKELDTSLRNKRFNAFITHTQHPLDMDGDKQLTVFIDTTHREPSSISDGHKSYSATVIAMIKNLLRPLVRKIRALSSNREPAAAPDRMHGQMAVRDRFADIKARLTESPVIVDGGANIGEMTAKFLRQYRSPVIHAFEPIPELVSQLHTRFTGLSNVTIHGMAMGAEAKTVNFNILNYMGSSSVFNPSAIVKSYHGEKMDVRQVVEVQQVRLEDVMGTNLEVDLLKLDLQGYELEALKGCGKLLERIKIITIEIEFVPLYDGQPLFGDIDVFLRAHGFKLLNLYELYTHPDGQLTAGDAVYLNSNYF
jgi:FkbM family methyltransferase